LVGTTAFSPIALLAYQLLAAQKSPNRRSNRRSWVKLLGLPEGQRRQAKNTSREPTEELIPVSICAAKSVRWLRTLGDPA
jgi:hypothetical protein